jgi:hypothetical protein
MNTPPIPFRWTGEAMMPRRPQQAMKAYEVGETYVLVPHEERSGVSHRHYFATVNECWQNLPEDIAEDFPTSEHLRKWAVIKAGYADERSIVCASKAEAQRVAAFVRPMDTYAVVLVSNATIKVYTAQSQSTKAMGAKAFQDSKQKVLDILSDLIGVEPQTLQREAGQAA